MHPWFYTFAAWCKETCLDLIGSLHSRRRQIRALRHLDDRLLHDIGLTRRGVRLAESMSTDGHASPMQKKVAINSVRDHRATAAPNKVSPRT